MRTLSRVLGVSAFLVLGVLPPLAAQRVISPDSLRYPRIMDSTAQVRLEAVVRLRVAELARAIQRADTLMLMQLLGDAEIPAAEVALARSRGCPSPGWAASQLAARSRRAGAPPELPLDRLAYSVRAVALTWSAEASAVIRLTDVSSTPQRFAEFVVEWLLENQGLNLRRIPGLLSTLCGLALAQ